MTLPVVGGCGIYAEVRWRRAIGVSAILAGAAALIAYRAPAARPNVVLVTMDTLRADRLGCYGGPLATPHVDQVAREGVRFDQAHCPMPMTRPSHASLFTSRAPREHGVLHNASALPADLPTLAEQLRGAGYQTAAFVSAWLLGPESGQTRGFDLVDAPPSHGFSSGQETVDRARAWLQTTGQAPFFLWVHLFDAHIPYQPAAAFAPQSPPDVAARLPAASWETLTAQARANGGDLPAALFERAKALYDGEVREVDAAVGQLVDALRARGVLDRTVVVLTADHGECFEHGIFFQHVTCLYEAAARVPLLVRYPPALPAGGQRRDAVELIDVAPTVLALAGAPRPIGFRGRSLFDADGAAPPVSVVQHPVPLDEIAARRQAVTGDIGSVAGMPARRWGSGRGQFAVIEGPWKAILSPHGAELYDLAADPDETDDRAATRSEAVAAARERLAEWQRTHPERAPRGAEVGPAARERLRALGYQ